MATLIVERLKEFDKVTDLKGRSEPSTTGKVTLIDGDETIFKGFSCENAGPDTDTPKQDKRIVAREYDLAWTATSKNGNKALGKWQNKALWVTCDGILPNFRDRRILIHTGNFPTDTEGCILIGKSENKQGAVNSSVNAITELFNAIDKIGVENVKLEVKNNIETGDTRNVSN